MTKGDENVGDGQDPPRPGARRHLDHQEAATCRCSHGPYDPAHCARSHYWTAPYDPCRPLERNGRRWLVATHGGASSNWVRNLRAAGEGILTRGRRRQAVTAVELSPEAAGPVLKEVLGPRLASPVRGLVLRRTLDVAPDASLDAFIDEARRHPIFELRSRPKASS